MFGGITYERQIHDWIVSWESLDEYRFWCKQEHPTNSRVAAVVMLNPGSLSANGEGLSKDSTLRILRDVFIGTSYNPFVINLFNFAAPKPSSLFQSWEHRDHPSFKFTTLPKEEFSAVMYAYGDYENNKMYSLEIKQRITELRSFMSEVPEIQVPRNKSGTPKHPLPVQRQKLKETFRQAIIAHASENPTITSRCP